MKRQFIYGILILLAGGFMLRTCNKENFDLDRLSDEMEFEPQLVAPLIYGSVTMSDLMELFDSIEYIDTLNDGLIYLAYKDTPVSVLADTAMALPELDAEEFYLESDVDIPVILPVPLDDTFFLAPRTRVIDFVLQGKDRLDEILIKNGELSVDIEHTFRNKCVMTVSSQQIIDPSGNPYMRTFAVDDTSGNFQISTSLPADSFLLDPLVRNDSNLIIMQFDLGMINSGYPINPGEFCRVQSSLHDANFYEAYGFIDTRDLIDQSGALEVPLWEEIPDLHSIEFADPRIEFTSSNSFGIPFAVDFDSVIATGAEGEQVELLLDGGNTLEFLAPGMAQIGETVTTHILINNSTSNIQEFLATAPSSVSYKVKGHTSVTGDDTTHFVLDQSQLDISIEFLLPMDFKSTGFAMSDTMNFELSEEGIDTSMVKNAEVSITTLNELPLELMLQVLLLDTNYAVVDSVFDDNAPILAAALVDSDGITTEGAEETNTIEFPAEKLGKLDRVLYMQVRARLLTSNNGSQFVKLYTRYTLDFEISMKANVRINTRKL
jgi:hypothetical protein